MEPKNSKPKSKGFYVGIIAAILIVAAILLLVYTVLAKPEDSNTTSPEPTNGTHSDVVETTPEPSEPVVDTVIEDLEAFQEPASSIQAEDATAPNDRVLTFEYIKGRTISFGIQDGAASDDGRVYLNPSCSMATEQDKVGYYITADRGELLYSSREPADPAALDANNVVITYYYNEATSAEYQDAESYGIAWRDNILADGQLGGCTLTVRAIRLHNGEQIAIMYVDIARNQDGSYTLERIRNADAYRGEDRVLTGDQRKEMLNLAKDFLLDDNGEVGFSTTMTEEHWKSVFAAAQIQVVRDTYFPKYFDEDGEMGYYGRIKNPFETFYAVNMSLIGPGVVTVYMTDYEGWKRAPDATEPTEGNLPPEGITQSENFTVIGYDAMYPFSKEELRVPDNWWYKGNE